MTVEAASLPIPPQELRDWVGPTDPADYDNPDRKPILAGFGIPDAAYASVFDFGCGCGRQARQMLQQQPRPRRYIGIDVKPELVDWCQRNLTPVDPGFVFVHHDVYSPWYAPGNSLTLSHPFPAADASVTLLLGTSVFTHLTKGQALYYLSEVARVLTPDGIAFTTWLFFDRHSFSFLPGVHCLYTSEIDFGQAVLFDREWFLATIRRLGLGITRTDPPQIPGHQWKIFLARRTPGMRDEFPLGMEGAEWVSGASLKPMAAPTLPPAMAAKHTRTSAIDVSEQRPDPPALFGPLAELEHLKRSRAWALGRALTLPVRMLKRLFGR